MEVGTTAYAIHKAYEQVAALNKELDDLTCSVEKEAENADRIAEIRTEIVKQTAILAGSGLTGTAFAITTIRQISCVAAFTTPL